MLLFVIALAVIAVFLSLGFLLSKALFMPEKAFPWTEEDGESLSFKSGRNTLKGILINKEGKKGTIVFSHGMGLSSHYYRPEVLHFASLGYRVFIFEYRGYGESDGTFLSFRDAYKDTIEAAEYITDPSMPLFLIGHSMGGYSSVSALDKLGCKVNGVAVYAPFRSPFSAMNVCAKRMGWTGRMAELFLFPFQILLSPISANRSLIGTINKTKVPVLILQGDRDKEVSLSGCSVLKKKAKITNSLLQVQLIEKEDSSGHISIVRKKGEGDINNDTMVYVDKFLSNLS